MSSSEEQEEFDKEDFDKLNREISRLLPQQSTPSFASH